MKITVGQNKQFEMETVAGLFVYHGFGSGDYYPTADHGIHMSVEEAYDTAKKAGLILQYQDCFRMPIDVVPPVPMPSEDEARLEYIRHEAEEAFWDVVYEHYPEAESCDFVMGIEQKEAMTKWIKCWVEYNVDIWMLKPRED